MSRNVSRPRGRPRKGTELDHEKLMGAALSVFAEHGFHGARLRSIADSADIDVALIAYHYGSKMDLWRAVITDLISSSLKSLETVQNDETWVDPVARLDAFVGAMVRLLSDRPQVAQLMIGELGDPSDMGRMEFIDEILVFPLRTMFLSVLEDAAEALGMNPVAETDIAYFSMIGMLAITVQRRAVISRFSPSARNGEKFQEALKDQIIRGLLSTFPTNA